MEKQDAAILSLSFGRIDTLKSSPSKVLMLSMIFNWQFWFTVKFLLRYLECPVHIQKVLVILATYIGDSRRTYLLLINCQ